MFAARRFRPFALVSVLAPVGLALTVAAPAHATVTSLYEQTIIVADPQSGDRCYRRVPVLGDFGVPSAVMMQATFSPYQVPHVPSPEQPLLVNINEVATTPALVASYREDSYDEATQTHMLRMTLDVSALAAAKGSTREGRQRVIEAAKLGLLAMAKNLDGLAKGRYQLWVEIKGLPTQTDLPGKRVYARTRYPYTNRSPLLLAYESELIDRSGSCG